jgi:superfamily II DNA or RNA helicase
MIEIFIDNVNCKIKGALSKDLYQELDLLMSYSHPGYMFMKGGKGGYGLGGKYGGWDGRIRLLTKSLVFPVGLLELAKDFFKEKDIEAKIVDVRPELSYGSPIAFIDETMDLRKYQQDVLEKAVSAGSGIIKVATGGGKSLIIASIAARYNIPTVIYVIGIELLYQMKETFERAYNIECGIVGGGKCELGKDVTIMTIWSAAAAFNKKAKIADNDTTQDSGKHMKLLNKAGVRRAVEEAQLFIFDECQYAASETLQFIHRASMAAKHRFLLSGTPWRDTGDDILIEAVSGRRFCDISATYLIGKGYLVPPDIHFVNVPVMRNVGKKYHDVYKNYVVENDERNQLIVKAARKLVAAKKRVLILVVRVQHGKILQDLLEDDFSVKFLDGGKSSSERLGTIEDVKKGGVEILIASKIFDQGVDIPELDALILAGSGKSSGRALQRIGRVIRLHPQKKKAIVVEFFDNCKYLRDHSEARIKVYESEPGFNVKMPKSKTLHSYPKRKPIKWS